MTIEEFIKARLEETERRWSGFGDMTATLGNFTRILWDLVEMHKKWPVLIEKPAKIERVDSSDISSLHYQMIQEMHFLTQEEYRKKFGDEPATAPMVLALARMWSDHPEFQDEWRE